MPSQQSTPSLIGRGGRGGRGKGKQWKSEREREELGATSNLHLARIYARDASIKMKVTRRGRKRRK